VLSVIFAFLTALAFSCAGYLRWNYAWKDAPWSDNGAESLRARRGGDSALGNHFSERRHHGRGLLVSEIVAASLSVLTFALLLTTVTVFTRHPKALRDDLNSCSGPSAAACRSFIGDSDQDDSYWRPAEGWSMACATICFTLAMMLTSLSAFVVRNNRFVDKDDEVRDAAEKRAQVSDNYRLAEGTLLTASSSWRCQEKVFLDAEYLLSYDNDGNAFPNDNSATAHVDRDEL
jgi:hypothetical protein